MIRRLLCLTLGHRWSPSWDYFAGVVHINAHCSRCRREQFQAVDLIRAGKAPAAGRGISCESEFGPIGPIIWDDQATWSSGGEIPAALLTYQAF